MYTLWIFLLNLTIFIWYIFKYFIRDVFAQGGNIDSLHSDKLTQNLPQLLMAHGLLAGAMILLEIVTGVTLVDGLRPLINGLVINSITVITLSVAIKIFHHKSDYSNKWNSILIYLLTGVTTLSGIGLFESIYDFEFEDIVSHIMRIVIITLIAIVTSRYLPHSSTQKFNLTKRHSSKKQKVSRDLKQYYMEQGLDDSEITYLREQLDTLRHQIYCIDNQMNQTAKLRAIDLRHNTIRLAKTYFQDIVKHPRRVTEASHAIYRIIPSLCDLSTKYNEVNQHLAKTKQTYIILEKTAATIEKLSQELVNSYLAFHQDTMNDLDDELAYVSQKVVDNQSSDEIH